MDNQHMSNLANQSQADHRPSATISSLPGATAILGQAWSIYKQRFGTFLGILGIMAIPMLIVTVFFAILVGGSSLLSSGYTHNVIVLFFPLAILFFGIIIFCWGQAALLLLIMAELLFAILVVYGVLNIIMGIINLLLSVEFALNSILNGIVSFILLAILFFGIFIFCWGQAALVYAIKDNGKIGVIESYRRGRHKIFSYWWVLLLAGFITMAGFLFLVVPGIIFSVWFSLAVFILIAEDLKGMNALLKSREYVKGKWGEVFHFLLFIGEISLIIFLVPILIFSLLELLEIPFTSVALKISQFIIVISELFLIPLATTYLFLVYSNLKSLKGEIAFAPTRGQKAAFIFVGILGFLFIAFLVLTVFSILLMMAYST